MPILTKRQFKDQQPEVSYTFELNKEEKTKFFDEFLAGFFDQSQLGDLELRETTVEFSMKLYKKQVEDVVAEDILID